MSLTTALFGAPSYKNWFLLTDINFQTPLVDLSTYINDFEAWLEKYKTDYDDNQELISLWSNVTNIEPVNTSTEEVMKPSLLALESSVRSVSPASALASHDYTECSFSNKKTFEVSTLSLALLSRLFYSENKA